MNPEVLHIVTTYSAGTKLAAWDVCFQSIFKTRIYLSNSACENGGIKIHKC
jgi:hypothetical protein